VFNLVIIKLDNIEKLKDIKNYKNLEVLLIKAINFSGRDMSIQENSVRYNY
jgi:hypothetical protein